MSVVSVSPNSPIFINSTPEASRTGLPLFNVLPGETLTLSVVEKISANQYLLAVNDARITATSDLPLQTGEKLQVKVQSLQPQIILNLLDASKQNTDAKVNERLLQWRINPDSLTQLLGKLSEFSAMLKSGDLPLSLSAKEIDGLMKLFSNIIFSNETKVNPLFVKDFISRLGLLLENDLSKMASRPARDGGAMAPAENLKASLLKLSADIAETLKDSLKFDPRITAKLMNLASFTSETLKTIEARQAVNVIYQQNESGLYLQIPLSLGEVLRQADIFITPDDKNAAGAKKYSSCSIMIFLDLDYLGEISIDASVREGRIRCVIKCESEEVRQLVTAAADRLKEALGGAGYGVEQVDCLTASELGQKRAEYIEQQLFGSVDLVNHFA